MKIYLELKKGKIYFKKLIMIERVMKAKLEKILKENDISYTKV